MLGRKAIKMNDKDVLDGGLRGGEGERAKEGADWAVSVLGKVRVK
jgi:hypothetical protein